MTASFGDRELVLGEIAKLGPGSVIELDRGVDTPLDLLVNGRCVARGELVALEDELAIRITEVLGMDERILTLAR